MVQSAGCINAGLTWHASQIPIAHLLINNETTSLYPHILLLTAIPLYSVFCSKIGHQVGLGYKVQGSRFRVNRFAFFSFTIDSIGVIQWRRQPLNL
jgi:hypothetical protein